MNDIELKPIIWIGSSLDDLKKLPIPVQRDVGFSLHQVQEGKMPHNAKPLKGIESGVLEIISDFNTNTYRAVYAIKFGDNVYVLHVFQKKSKKGIETPKKEIDLIKQRLFAVKENIKKPNK